MPSRALSPRPFAAFSPDADTEPSDGGPPSDVHPIDFAAQRLVIDTGLRGRAAQAAWVTVTGADGVLYFEGSMSADGSVEVTFEGSHWVDRVCVRLETPTTHRQAEVPLGAGWTAHVFS